MGARMKRAARELRDLFLGPADGDLFEQTVPRLCSVLLALIVAASCVARWMA